MKDKDIEVLTGDMVQDLGIDIARRVMFGSTRNIGRDACRKVFGNGIFGQAGYLAANILTGGALSLLQWIGPAEKVGKSLTKHVNSQRWQEWAHRYEDLNKHFVEAVEVKKNRDTEDISSSERDRLQREVDRAHGKLRRHLDRMPT